LRARFPQFPTDCEDISSSSLFSRTFHAVVAVGVMFLLRPEQQRELIRRVAAAVAPGGVFLFTAPAQPAQWTYILTGNPSYSLGTDAYVAALDAASLTLVREFEDEGANHYFLARKDAAV
jgi:O-methyltransferase involved in polyketide biosynthesis